MTEHRHEWTPTETGYACGCREEVPRTVNYVGWGGAFRTLPVTYDLGVTASTVNVRHRYGLRRALWDAAFGHVNGFPPSAILYFVLTRSLNRTVCEWTLRWEAR